MCFTFKTLLILYCIYVTTNITNPECFYLSASRESQLFINCEIRSSKKFFEIEKISKNVI